MGAIIPRWGEELAIMINMKRRLSLMLVIGILVAILMAAELFAQRRKAAILALSATATYPTPPTETPRFDGFPTHRAVSISPTAIPLQATHTSIAGETPILLATETLIPIYTPTLISMGTEATSVPTQTLIFFATATVTPFGGSPTPPASVAYAIDNKPTACYKGPSLAYIQMDTFKISRIAGKDRLGEWWFLLISKGQGVYVSCWVATDQVTTGGDLSTLSVIEPGISQITQVKVTAPGQPADATEYTASIACDDGISSHTLRFTGQIFADGPMSDTGYRWDTDAPVKFKAARIPIQSWDVPAQITLELPVPAKAARYHLSLRTTFPAEMVGGLKINVKCQSGSP